MEAGMSAGVSPSMFAVMQSSPGCPSLALEAWALQLGGRHLRIICKLAKLCSELDAAWGARELHQL